MAGLEIRAADGTPLAAGRLRGTGPSVVLLHAGVADQRAWADVMPGLNARGADVVAYDRRGFGETPATAAPFRQVDDLLSVLDATTDGPVWLVGNSQGGRVALDVAFEHPDRIAGLVLFAPGVSGAPGLEHFGLDDATRAIDEEIDRADESGDLDAVNHLEIRLWLDGPAGLEGRVAGPARELALHMNAIALAAESSDGEGFAAPDTWAALEEIRLPVTVIWGVLDLPPVIACCRVLVARLANVPEAVELAGVAHLPMLEQPEAVARLIAGAVGLENSRYGRFSLGAA